MDNGKETDPWQEKVFPRHHVQSISWIHPAFCRMGTVNSILGGGKGRGSTAFRKHAVLLQLSLNAFIHCIWTIVPNSVPREILFHGLYTKYKKCSIKPFNIRYSKPLELKMAVYMCKNQTINVQWPSSRKGATAIACYSTSYRINKQIQIALISNF